MQKELLPVKEPKYRTLPYGSIHPKDWVLRHLKIHARGIPGRADEFFFKGEYWLGGDGARDPSRRPTDAGSSHIAVIWLKNLVHLAYMLDDKKLKGKAQGYIEYILSTRKSDGSFGPDAPKDSIWPDVTCEYAGYEGARIGAAEILLDYYSFTKDERCLDLVKSFVIDYYGKHYKPGTYSWFNNIFQGSIRSLAYSLYSITGDIACMKAVEEHSKYSTSESDWKTGYKNKDPKCTHGALFGGLATIANDYLFSGGEDCKEVIDEGLKWLDETQAQVGGNYTAHEFIAWSDGRNPTNGSECCPISDHLTALQRLYVVYGDTSYADRLEELMFNAVPAYMTADAWARQYDQQANQVLCTVAKRRFDNRDDANIFGINPHYPCCTGTVGGPLPAFVNHQWMKTADNGLVALSYIPVEVRIQVGDENVNCKLSVDSEYPWRGKGIRFTVNVEKAVRFTIYLRAPKYIGDYGERTAIMLDGKMTKIEPNSVYAIEREWHDGDSFEMNIPMNTKFIRRSDSSVAVKRGPLYYALRIGEAYRQLKHNYEGSADWEIYPATRWNIGLYANFRAAYASVIEEHHQIPEFPWAHQEELLYDENDKAFKTWREKEPVILHVRGRVIRNWGYHRIYAMSDEIPVEKDREYGEEVKVELIPYGCSNLRISEFPFIS